MNEKCRNKNVRTDNCHCHLDASSWDGEPVIGARDGQGVAL